MTLQVIGAGVGRTGTYSLRTALNHLGLGPCHHMREIIFNMPVQLPKWQAAAAGKPDWPAAYEGYNSAVDWPTAAFVGELNAAYPKARFILTVRNTQSWAESFSATIYKLIAGRDHAPPHMRDWLDMGIGIISKTGFPLGLDVAGLAKAFEAHSEAVKAEIPAERLLVYEVKQGWEPLCKFLGVPVPPDAFPRTNDRADFWERINSVS